MCSFSDVNLVRKYASCIGEPSPHVPSRPILSSESSTALKLTQDSHVMGESSKTLMNKASEVLESTSFKSLNEELHKLTQEQRIRKLVNKNLAEVRLRRTNLLKDKEKAENCLQQLQSAKIKVDGELERVNAVILSSEANINQIKNEFKNIIS